MSRQEYVKIILRVANCEDASAPHVKARGNCVRAITIRGPKGEPDIILLSEVATVDVEHLAKVHGGIGLQFGYDGAQGDGDPRAGCAIVINPDTCSFMDQARIVETAPQDEGIRTRYAVSDKIKVKGTRGWARRFWACHGNPARATKGVIRFFKSFRRLMPAVGGDMNKIPSWMVNNIRRRYIGREVLGFAFPKSWIVNFIGEIEIGSDHKALDYEILVPIKRRRFRRA